MIYDEVKLIPFASAKTSFFFPPFSTLLHNGNSHMIDSQRQTSINMSDSDDSYYNQGFESDESMTGEDQTLKAIGPATPSSNARSEDVATPPIIDHTTTSSSHDQENTCTREEQAMAMYQSAFAATSSSPSKQRKKNKNKNKNQNKKQQNQSRETQAMDCYHAAFVAASTKKKNTQSKHLRSRTVATQTNDSWLPELIQKIVAQRVQEEQTKRERNNNQKNNDALEFMDHVPQQLPTLQESQSLDNFLASSPFPFHQDTAINSAVSSARQHRLKRLNNNVYQRQRHRSSKKKKSKKRSEHEKTALLLQNVRRVINMNRKGAISVFRQNDQSGGSGTLGITDIRAAFKKLHLSLTTDETVLIVLSLRQRNRDSKLSLNYFKLLRAVSLFCFLCCYFWFFFF
jgi:hypothetical protein